jgi:hypothetical protein
MRLNEFAESKQYTPTSTDADGFFSELLLIWPGRSADDPTSSILGHVRQLPIKRTKLSDTLSIATHVGGAQLRSRRGASQWPTA